MEAVILAGGLGTRLRGAIPDLPKPLAPINGVPFLEILLNYLKSLDFTAVTICVGYKSNEIVEQIGHKFNGLQIRYSVETQPLGTGGALKLALRNIESEFAYVANGDSFLDIADKSIFQKKIDFQSIFSVHVEDTSRYGRLKVMNGRVVSLKEKDANGPGLINAGSYIIKKSFLESCIESRFSLEDKIMDMLEVDYFGCNFMHGRFIDIGIPQDYLRSQKLLFEESMRVKSE